MAAALITGLIGTLKSLPQLGDVIKARSLEPWLAFIGSALLVGWAFVTYGPWTPEGGFLALVGFYGLARLSMGIHDDVKARSIGG
jgi:hypothetical protein